MKRWAIPAGIAGFCLAGVIVAMSGFDGVVEAVVAAAPAALAVVLLRVVAVGFDGVAWRYLFPRGLRPSVGLCVVLRFVREAVNQMLPVAQVGGDFVGARLATFRRVEGALAGASVIVDIMMQAGTQFVFAVVGLALLVALDGDSPLVRYVGAGLLVASLALGGFLVAQRGGGSRIVSALLHRIADGREWLGVAAVERLYARIAEIYAQPRGVATGALIHMAVWFVGALEVYVAFRVMGHEVSLGQAIVIESLGQAVRGAGFAVPGALGVQEGGFVVLAAVFGIPAQPALALSLLKRVADLAIGIPGLIGWQIVESRKALGLSAASAAAAAGAAAAASAIGALAGSSEPAVAAGGDAA